MTGKHRKWLPSPSIFHYARTLEKYALKQRTWETASAESHHGYSVSNYLERAFGFEFDNRAVVHGCALRALLAQRTGEESYLRPGDFWYRNPEFGKVVGDPSKRGRNGGGFGKVLMANEWNPYPLGDTYQKGHKSYKAPEVS